MKTLVLGLVSLSLLNLTAHGQGQDVQVRERAKNIANQNNARQGAAPPPAQPTPGAAPMPAPVARPPSVQQQNMAKLKADLVHVRQEGKVTDKAKQEFVKDLQAAVQGSGRPSAATLSSLADHLLPVVASNTVPATADDKLVAKLQVMLNSGGLPAKRSKEIAGEAQASLQTAGVSEDVAAKIAADLESIAAEVEQTRHQ